MFTSRRRRQEKVVVGLELDPSHIAAAEVRVNGVITATKGAVAPLPAGLIRDGEVVDAQALADVLRAFFAEHELPTTVRLGIAHQRIVVRTLDVPLLTNPKALATAVEDAAPDHIPMPMDEAVLDFQSLGAVETPEGPRTRVVIVAVRRTMIDQVVAAAEGAGLQIAGIDLSAFAMVRALRFAVAGDAVLFINVAGLTNVAVAGPEGCLFTRSGGGGLDAIVGTLSGKAGLTGEHARGWLQHVGLQTPLDEIDGDPAIIATTRAVLEEGVNELADAVRSSLNFYRAQDSAATVERAVLTGPAVAIPGVAELLASELRIPVAQAVVAVDDDIADAGRLTVAAGLAVDDIP